MDHDFAAWSAEQRALANSPLSPSEKRAKDMREASQQRSAEFLKADRQYKDLEAQMLAAKAERDRLGESARMHTEATQKVDEKNQATLGPKIPAGGLGRVIEEVQMNDKQH